ncbi:MAG TPA: hypothetical protein VE712_02220 [Actinomycetota bacterium]|nr:hypothetical protein [Actinomycetota bacterium]
MTGVVVKVESVSLGDVKSFTLRSEGRNYVVYLGPDADLAFPPAHLNEHLATSQPVKVELDRRRGRYFALSVRDA